MRKELVSHTDPVRVVWNWSNWHNISYQIRKLKSKKKQLEKVEGKGRKSEDYGNESDTEEFSSYNSLGGSTDDIWRSDASIGLIRRSIM